MKKQPVESAREAARVLLSGVKLASEPARGRAAFRTDAMFKVADSRFESPMTAAALIEAAEAGDPVATEAVHQAIIWFVRNDEPLTEQLREYLIELLLLRPGRKQKRGRHHDNYLRDDRIKFAVKAAMDCGLGHTRNDATDGPSACSVVAEVLAENGVHMDESNVERITRPSRKPTFG